MPAPNTILIVDDEPDLVELIQLRFRQQVRAGRFRFVAAGDGVSALEVLDQNEDIDLLLTDIRMPRMDGLSLLSRLGDLDRTPHAIVVTAYGDMENLRTAMNRGAFDFLTKPLDFEDLEVTIQKALRAVEQQKRALHVRELFGRYVSAEILSALLKDASGANLGGERRDVTLLMSDLRGFTRLTEALPPEKVVEVLNIYLGAMTEVIARHGGTIDEFIGDAIFVIFGAPLKRQNEALHAAACAIEMQTAMRAVNDRLSDLKLPPVQMGIGLNTGEVVVGNIGSARRAKYGVVGSPVNLVSRIQTYTVGGQILASEATVGAAGPVLRTGRRLEVSPKGFSERLILSEVVELGAPYDLRLPNAHEGLRRLPAPMDQGMR